MDDASCDYCLQTEPIVRRGFKEGILVCQDCNAKGEFIIRTRNQNCNIIYSLPVLYIIGKILCCLPISLFHIYFLYIWKHFVKIVNDSPPLVYGIQCHLSQTHPGVSMAMHRLQDVHRLSRLRWPCKLPTACENALIHFGRWYHYWRVKKTKKISWWLQVLVWLLICRTRCCFVTPVIRGIIWPAMNRP